MSKALRLTELWFGLDPVKTPLLICCWSLNSVGLVLGFTEILFTNELKNFGLIYGNGPSLFN